MPQQEVEPNKARAAVERAISRAHRHIDNIAANIVGRLPHSSLAALLYIRELPSFKDRLLTTARSISNDLEHNPANTVMAQLNTAAADGSLSIQQKVEIEFWKILAKELGIGDQVAEQAGLTSGVSGFQHRAGRPETGRKR